MQSDERQENPCPSWPYCKHLCAVLTFPLTHDLLQQRCTAASGALLGILEAIHAIFFGMAAALTSESALQPAWGVCEVSRWGQASLQCLH